MSEYNPDWYNLIETAKKRGDIVTGLTIPYIIGALEKDNPNFIATENDVFDLLTDIVTSNTELTAVLKECDLIHQYVVALQSADFCEENFKTQISFRNENGVNSLFVIHEAKLLGSSIKEISHNLFDQYTKPSFETKKYSWNYTEKDWFPFSDREKETINEALK